MAIPDMEPPDAAPVQNLHIRIIAANLTSENAQSYDPGHGARIMEGLDPDVVLIQEFNYGGNSAGDIAAFVRNTFGASFTYFREPRGSIPNGIISRWPISAAGSWDDPEVNNRGFAWARIQLPGGRTLLAVSLHLLTSGSGTRNDEARALVPLIQRALLPQEFLVVGGDLNTDSSNESVFNTLRQVVSNRHHAADHRGDTGTNASRRKPYDWVMPSLALEEFHVAVQIGNQSFPHGLVFDSRIYRPLTDVVPVRQGDSGASNMQHMAVVRDFFLP